MTPPAARRRPRRPPTGWPRPESRLARPPPGVVSAENHAFEKCRQLQRLPRILRTSCRRKLASTGRGRPHGAPGLVPLARERGTVEFYARTCDAAGPYVCSARPGSGHLPRRGAGVVDRDGLENRCAGNRTEGSNPSLSASCHIYDTVIAIEFPSMRRFTPIFTPTRVEPQPELMRRRRCGKRSRRRGRLAR